MIGPETNHCCDNVISPTTCFFSRGGKLSIVFQELKLTCDICDITK